MEEIKKETIVKKGYDINEDSNISTKVEASNSQTIEYLIFFFFGVLEILLSFRLVLMVTGANSTSTFVKFIYNLTNIAVLPFEGIFRSFSGEGLETTSVLQPAVIIAIIVYAILAFGIVKLVRILSGERQERD